MLPHLIVEWAQWMRAGNMAARTITERTQFVQRFDRDVDGGALAARWQAIADYLADPAYSTGTRATYFALLQAWFAWLSLMGLRLDNPTELMRAPKMPRRRPRPVTVEQLGDMLRTPHHHRTTAMVLLAAYEGLRVHEVARFRGEDIIGRKVRVTGKGDVRDELPLHELVALIATTMPTRGYWFPSPVVEGAPVGAKSVSKIICELMRRAEVPSTAHALRHFYGTESLRSSGGNLALVRELMRHANIQTTAGYTLIDDVDKLAAVAAMPVPGWTIPGTGVVTGRARTRRIAPARPRSPTLAAWGDVGRQTGPMQRPRSCTEARRC